MNHWKIMSPEKVNLHITDFACVFICFMIRREFVELMEKYGSSSSTSSGSDTSVSTGNFHYVYHFTEFQEWMTNVWFWELVETDKNSLQCASLEKDLDLVLHNIIVFYIKSHFYHWFLHEEPFLNQVCIRIDLKQCMCVHYLLKS